MTKHINQGQCGYWSFVPEVREACGTYTTSRVIDFPGHCNDIVTTTQNACVQDLIHFNTGIRDVHGTIIFVYVDCVTLKPSDDPKVQDPVFLLPGVALPREASLANSYEAFWKTSLNKGNSFFATSNTVQCTKDIQNVVLSSLGYANSTDCLDAIGNLLLDGTNFVGTSNAKAGQTVDVTVSTSEFPMIIC